MYEQDGDDLRSSFTTYLAEGDKVRTKDSNNAIYFELSFDMINIFLAFPKWRFSKGTGIVY